MAENENRVSAVQEAPDSPQEPAALDTPPSEMPVYEPARPVRRVGTLTMGLALVVVGAADLKAGDYVGVSAELKGTWATREEFVAACRPVIEAVRATGVRDPYISLYMRESRDTETPLYSLAVEGSYQADMTAEQLAQCVTERIYVDDAGYYMDAEELAGWQSEQSSAARDAELEALEAEWQARLDEAEAAAEQARAEAEERVAQAQAEADERVAQAQADADSRVAEAQANAAA